MNEMMIESGLSIESAYDKAIEVAAGKIQLAFRPLCTERTPVDDNNAADTTDTTITIDKCDSDSDSDRYDNDSDIESTILFLEEKKNILKKAQIRERNEQAYTAHHACKILNDHKNRSSSKCSSSVWSEAKNILEEFKSGVGGNNDEGDNEGRKNHNNSLVPEEQKSSSLLSSLKRPHSVSNFNDNHRSLLKGSSSLDDPSRKRLKIDLSSVKNVSSTKFDACSNDDDDDDDANRIVDLNHTNTTAKNICEEASKMQFATDPRNWITKAVLNNIFALTNTVIDNHRRSLIAAEAI